MTRTPLPSTSPQAAWLAMLQIDIGAAMAAGGGMPLDVQVVARDVLAGAAWGAFRRGAEQLMAAAMDTGPQAVGSARALERMPELLRALALALALVGDPEPT